MKSTVISIIVTIILISAAFMLVRSEGSDQSGAVPENNVTVVDGKQIIEIRAKGGYLPRQSVAKAGMPTILRFETSGTFDCSSSVRIPAMDISKSLPPSGMTDIDLENPAVGTLQGTCGMGMYPFEIVFEK